MEYQVEGKKFSYSYQEIKDAYNEVVAYSDEEFIDNLPNILHFATFLCYIKEIPT